MSWDVGAPAAWPNLPESDQDEGNFLNRDFCVLNDEHFFIKGNLEIPVSGLSDKFTWNVWVSLSRSNYERSQALMGETNRSGEPPYFGWLCSQIPIYPETLHLKSNVHTRPVGIRPYIELEPTDHPLAVEQRQGITPRRVREIAALLFHR